MPVSTSISHWCLDVAKESTCKEQSYCILVVIVVAVAVAVAVAVVVFVAVAVAMAVVAVGIAVVVVIVHNFFCDLFHNPSMTSSSFIIILTYPRLLLLLWCRWLLLLLSLGLTSCHCHTKIILKWFFYEAMDWQD